MYNRICVLCGSNINGVQLCTTKLVHTSLLNTMEYEYLFDVCEECYKKFLNLRRKIKMGDIKVIEDDLCSSCMKFDVCSYKKHYNAMNTLLKSKFNDIPEDCRDFMVLPSPHCKFYLNKNQSIRTERGIDSHNNPGL